MNISATHIEAVRIVQPRRIGDARGWFEETWRADAFEAAGLDMTFVQDNQSFSARPGTVRGLHYQMPPFAQAKLVRVVSGAILDVAVDLRRGSPTFGRHVAVRLDAENGTQLFIPEGFAHGFCTLVENTAVAYKVSAVYSRDHDRGLRWNDPALGIDWPVSEQQAQLSDKDRVTPLLADIEDLF